MTTRARGIPIRWEDFIKYMESWKKGNDKHKCMKCKLVPCINLYRQSDNAEGGELYLYESTVKNRVHLPCEFGVLIYCLCQLSVPISDALSFELYNQCIRDLKAVSFLVFTGHYRNAMQIMRPVIENFLAGLYWDIKFAESSSDVEKQQMVLNEYEKFKEHDKYEIPEQDRNEAYGSNDLRKKKYLDQEFLLEWLLMKKVIKGKDKAKLQKMIGILNKFLHPAYKATDFGRAECTSCPSCVSLDETEYRKCIEIFQATTTLLLATFREYIVTFSPNELENPDVKEALDMIRTLPKLEAEIGRQLVFSSDLKEFMKDLETPVDAK